MSEVKLISPLLDNFMMGDPISMHHGIRCCPAIDKESDQKYIIKIISVPSSQNQVQALQLAGIVKDDEGAQAYFQNRAADTEQEIGVLQQLARQDGFFACDGYQRVPMEDGIGFDIYLRTPYKRTLARQFDKKPLTHLDALNLGLDLCAALAVCRRSGYLFVNLKPSNIFITENGEYKIGDLGFIRLSGLKYATLAEQYISPYTPPEITDSLSSPNETADLYALGMILYQIYNGGVLPERGEEPLPRPQYADEELSEIIMKAICKDPTERWQDPAQMGQSLVSYMQKNGASDSPIIPLPEPEEPEEAVALEETEGIADCGGEVPEEVPSQVEEDPQPEAEAAIEPEAEPSAEETVLATAPEAEGEPEEPDEIAQITASIEDILQDDNEEALADISYDEVSDEVSQILSQAEELAALEVPEPVVAPEAIEVQLPGSECDEAPEEVQAEPAEVPEEIPEETAPEEELPQEKAAKKPHPVRNVLLCLLGVLLVAAGFLFYQFYVLQTIDDLQLSGSKDLLSVSVTSETDEQMLSITCTDTYGKSVTAQVIDGKADFSGLSAGTEYTVTVNIQGLHILNGKTQTSYFTPSETSIVQCSVVTGNASGTAILSFSVVGPDSEQWTFTYEAPGTEEKTVTFSGHTANLTELTEDQVYSGVLRPVDELFILQEPIITFTATELIQANNLMITSCTDGKLCAKWSAPENLPVESWTVRCFSENGYDETQTVTETSALFENLDHTDSFTVEVTAAGQSVSQRTSVGENAITVSELTAESVTNAQIRLTWNATDTPENGWIVSYTVNGSSLSFSLSASENSVSISPVVPECLYLFTVQAADGTATACEPLSVQTAERENFSVNYAGNLVEKSNLHFTMCKRPANGIWSHSTMDSTDYTTVFSAGDSAGFVIFLDRRYDVSKETVTSAFVIYNSEGEIISIDTSSASWSNMWYKNYCDLNIPSIPQESGDYTIEVYFNGQLAAVKTFSIT